MASARIRTECGFKSGAESLTESHEFLGHASQDSKSRSSKARKIEALLACRCTLRGAHLIDIGTGSGVIAKHFADLRADVVATDRDAVRPIPGIPFHRTADSSLPFETGKFDVVIYNHVIEHVGERADQLEHLTEIRRILRPGGLLYIAVPNRWAIMEPHYRIPFLSWISARSASSLLRLTRKGRLYDCRPLSRRELERMLREVGFSAEDVTLEALEHFMRHELSRTMRHIVSIVPRSVVRALMPIIPTIVFIARA
jgi:2-polyprenyl-3-methyl-5-hydroxy-6-metoxy-1,4-benzoquinol methylase